MVVVYTTLTRGEQGCVERRKPCCVSSPMTTDCPRSYATIVPDTGRSVKCSTRIPRSLTAVHEDLQKLSEGDSQGREGDFTSENILRALIVQDMEGLPFREAVIRIGGDGFLQDFAADAEEGGDGFHLSGQVLPGDSAGDLETGERTAGPLRRGAGSGEPEGDPHGHDGGGVEHPLPDRRVAAVGYVAGGDAAVGAGAGDSPQKACRTVSTIARSKGCTCTSPATCRASRSLASGG